jgi:hypothetical protein
MRRLLLISLAGFVAAAAVATASAGDPQPPPLPNVRVGISRSHPVGKLFIGLTAVRWYGKNLSTFKCDAAVGDKMLHGRVRWYYPGPHTAAVAVSCGWLIPEDAAGQTLHTGGYQGSAWISGVGVHAAWRVQG